MSILLTIRNSYFWGAMEMHWVRLEETTLRWLVSTVYSFWLALDTLIDAIVAYSFSIKHGYLVTTCCSQCLIVHGVGVGWHEYNRVETFHLFITKHASFSPSVPTSFATLLWKTHPVPAQMEVHVLHWGPSSFPKSPLGDTTPSIIPRSSLHFHFFSFSWNSSTSIQTTLKSLL